jgi:hypothetical protein
VLIVPVAALSLTGLIQAQEDQTNAILKPMFTVLHPKPDANLVQPAVKVPTWSGSYTYKGTGIFLRDGWQGGRAATPPPTVPVYIIPVKIVIKTSTFDPSHVLTNGKTVSKIRWILRFSIPPQPTCRAGSMWGTTQYIDAYQRANFWGKGAAHPNYHLLLGGTDRACGTDSNSSGE